MVAPPAPRPWKRLVWNRATSKSVRPSNIVRNFEDNLMVGRLVKLTSVGVDKQPCGLVRVKRNEFDNYFTRYFTNSSTFWAVDTGKAISGRSGERCAVGDVVLIRKMAEPLTLKVAHEIERRIFQHGHVVDQITGKRIYDAKYEDVIQRKSKIVSEVLDQRLTARQLAAIRLKGSDVNKDALKSYTAEEKIE